MMVKAEHWVNHNGVWYRPGEEYEVGVSQQALQPQSEAEQTKDEIQPVKRGRKRQTKE